MALRITAELGGDGTGFERMMARAGVTANSFANRAINPLKSAIAGAFSVGAISALTRSTIDYASHIRDLGDEFGVNVEWLQQMQFVMKQNGGNAEELQKILRRIAVAREAALSAGGEKQLNAFAKFGVGVEQIQHGKLTDIVDQIAKAFETGSQQELIPAFQAIGGRGASVLVPSFIDGLANGRAAAMKAGAVISEDVIDQLDDVDDAMARFGVTLKARFAPAIISAINWLNRFIDKLEFIAAMREADANDKTVAEAQNRIDSARGKALEKVNARQEAGTLSKEDADRLRKQLLGIDATGNDEILRETMAEIRERRKADEDELNERKRNRHKRENGDLNVEPLSPEKGHFQFAKNSDSLSSVGNFLGANGAGASLVSIGERTNQLLTQTNTKLDASLVTLNGILMFLSNGMGSGVPEP